MKKLDYFVLLFFALLVAFFLIGTTRDAFVTFTSNYPILGGFLKFFVLATFGDLLSLRIKHKRWVKPTGLLYKAIVWGFIGIVIVLVFNIFAAGVASLQTKGILPFAQSTFAFALFTSILMNVTFAPTMMGFHRIADRIIDLKKEKKYVSFKDSVGQIDWPYFNSFIVLKTIPFFWIPAHTITFLLPETYRVLFAALLGIALGLILGLFNTKKEI